MSGLFEHLDGLDFDGHVRRWSAVDVGRAEGDASQWMAAAQQFAARLQEDSGRLTDEQWQAVGTAWAALLAAAGQATGPDEDEWLFRDLWLRSWLLQTLGPRDDVPLFDPEFVLVAGKDHVVSFGKCLHIARSPL